MTFLFLGAIALAALLLYWMAMPKTCSNDAQDPDAASVSTAMRAIRTKAAPAASTGN